MTEGLNRVRHVDKEDNRAADGLHGMYEVIVPGSAVLVSTVSNYSRMLLPGACKVM